MEIKVTVVMPSYNGRDYLPAALDSLLAQSLREIEIIVVDDGSTDGSGAICDAYAQKDSRIRVIHQENRGICAARNAGLAQARGEFVGFMDNDDYLYPDTLEENYRLALREQADWVKFGKEEVILGGERILAVKPTDFSFAVYDHDALIQNLMTLRDQGAMTFPWDFLARRSLLAGQTFDENFRYGSEDIDFCEELAEKCQRLVVNPHWGYRHFTRVGIGHSSRFAPQMAQSYLYMLEKSNARYHALGIDGPETDAPYARVVTRQVVASLCLKVNGAGKALPFRGKCALLGEVYKDPALSRYLACLPKALEGAPKKLQLYGRLFASGRFGTLLLLDRYSRQLIRALRILRAQFKNKEA